MPGAYQHARQSQDVAGLDQLAANLEPAAIRFGGGVPEQSGRTERERRGSGERGGRDAPQIGRRRRLAPKEVQRRECQQHAQRETHGARLGGARPTCQAVGTRHMAPLAGLSEGHYVQPARALG